MYTLDRIAPGIYLLTLVGRVDIPELQQMRRDILICLIENDDPSPVLVYDLMHYGGHVPMGIEDDPYTMAWFRHRGCIYVYVSLPIRLRLVYRHLLYRRFLPRAYFADTLDEALDLAKMLV